MADLSIDRQALADFAGQLRGLVGDFSAPVLPPWTGVCDGTVFDELETLSANDQSCGSSLNNYLTSLASYVDQAVQTAGEVDAKLAGSVPGGGLHHRLLAEAP